MNLDLPLIIVNPVSGKGTTEKQWASFADTIRAYFGPFECLFTRGPEDGTRIAEEEAGKGRKWVIAFGGDGTISEVANGLIRAGTRAELGILPHGTGGDLHKTLGMPSRLADAARKLRSAVSRRIDVGRVTYVNRTGKEESRCFVNSTSFGMSGKVASRVNRSLNKWVGGTVTYMMATLQTVFTYDHPEVLIEVDGESPKRLRIITACVVNGPIFGGGMKIAPDAKMTDGLLDLVIIGDLSTMSVLLNSHKLYSGTLHHVDKVGYRNAKRVAASPVETGLEILLEVDGETPGRLPATFEVLPSSLALRC